MHVLVALFNYYLFHYVSILNSDILESVGEWLCVALLRFFGVLKTHGKFTIPYIDVS